MDVYYWLIWKKWTSLLWLIFGPVVYFNFSFIGQPEDFMDSQGDPSEVEKLLSTSLLLSREYATYLTSWIRNSFLNRRYIYSTSIQSGRKKVISRPQKWVLKITQTGLLFYAHLTIKCANSSNYLINVNFFANFSFEC